MNNYYKNLFEKDLEQKKNKDNFRYLRILEENSGRKILIDGQKLINFASNDYLGLSNDERLSINGYEVSKIWGAGSTSSRLISGTFLPVNQLEEELACWAGKEKGLMFSSGYHANIGLLSSIASRDSVIFTDKLNHASIYDGIVLSRAKMERYPHCDIEALKKLLLKYKDNKNKIIITDSIFSMEGDIAPLRDIVKLAKEHEALMIVDEAHSFGLFGNNGNGLVNEYNLTKDIDIIMGTLGKSFGVFGAFILADKITIDYVINNCRSFIFTTALPPFVIGAVSKALEIIKTENRGGQTLTKARNLLSLLKHDGINTGNCNSQIIPIIVGSNEKAISLMNELKANGFYAPAIRPPTVPLNSSRVRLSVSYYHTEDDIKNVFKIIQKWVIKEFL